MKRQVIAFDLDDTLVVSKQDITDLMAERLLQLLEEYDVCIISGGMFDQFKFQVIDRLVAHPELMPRLHIMPTCGTRYYRYNKKTGEWNKLYAEDIPDDLKNRATELLEEGAKHLGLWEENPNGDIIEDRLSQITFSALGQKALPEDKYKWDPDMKKRQTLRDYVAERLPELEIRVGGTTSVDITRPGIDKAYGMRKLMEALKLKEEDILFIGDKLEEGGNDYPVKAMGIDCITVTRWEETALVTEAILKATRNT